MRRISASEHPLMSLPWRRIRPSAIRPPGGRRRRIDRAVSDFPHPDSPTRENVSPGKISKLTRSTGTRTPALVSSTVRKLLICSTGFTDISVGTLRRAPLPLLSGSTIWRSTAAFTSYITHRSRVGKHEGVCACCHSFRISPSRVLMSVAARSSRRGGCSGRASWRTRRRGRSVRLLRAACGGR